jgi:phosphonate transport system substrate-binding protein
MKKIVMLVSCLLLQAWSVAAPAAEKLVFGLIAPTDAEDTRRRWQPLLDDLSKATGMDVQVLVSGRYDDVVNGLKNNTVQVAWLSNKVALEAVESGKASVFAKMIRLDGSKGYNSVLITQASGQLQNTDQLFAQPGVFRFADGEPNSTSGHLVPTYYLFSKNKVEPAKLFRQVRNGSHKDNLKAVLHSEVDVATYNSEGLDLLKTEAPADFKKLRVIWTSPLIPNDPLLYRKDLSPALKNKLEDFFANYGKRANASQKETLRAIQNLSGFARSNDAQLKPVADLTMFSLLRQSLNDTQLTPEQKQKRFDELSARFGKLSAILESARLN